MAVKWPMTECYFKLCILLYYKLSSQSITSQPIRVSDSFVQLIITLIFTLYIINPSHVCTKCFYITQNQLSYSLWCHACTVGMCARTNDANITQCVPLKEYKAMCLHGCHGNTNSHSNTIANVMLSPLTRAST